MKRYTSFEDVDRDLKFLKLKSKIDIEEVKFGFYNTREMMKEAVSPANLLATTFASVAKKTFMLRVVDRLVGMTPILGRFIK